MGPELVTVPSDTHPTDHTSALNEYWVPCPLWALNISGARYDGVALLATWGDLVSTKQLTHNQKKLCLQGPTHTKTRKFLVMRAAMLACCA